jgi:serine/threonine protein kinase
MEPGEVVAARFELIEYAAQGGMGVVWKARDRHTDEIVALKVIEQAGETAIKRFSREARVLASMRHPAIVRHIAHGSIGVGSVFLAMELLSGESLDVRLRRGTLSIRDTLELGERVALALALAHERGVVHRDVKPSNLFLVDSEVSRVTLLDFGVARMQGLTSLTRPGQPLGTPSYMAPEQAKNKAKAVHDPRLDVYGLGLVMFECLAGRPAFVAKNMVAVLAKVLFEPPPRLRDYRADAPRRMVELVERLMHREREERPADGAQAAASIEAVLRDEDRRLSSAPPPPDLPAGAAARQVVSVVMVLDPERKGSRSSRTAGELRNWRAIVEEIAERAQGHAELLAEGSPVVVLPGSDDAEKHARHAAEVALELQSALHEVIIGVSTVAGVGGDARTLVGTAIDIASAMLAQTDLVAGTIHVDNPTARLLEGQLKVRTVGGHNRIDADTIATE